MLIQHLLSLYDNPRYLEIGVQEGLSFHAVSAARKVAVDPKFLFDVDDARIKNPAAEYYEITSDDFFSSYNGDKFDVVYIDGLHTSDQALRDLLNVLQHIDRKSVVILDDVGPNSFAASLRSQDDMRKVKSLLGDNDPSWMGDVYKLCHFINCFMQQFSFACPIGQNPQLVLWHEPRVSTGDLTISQVGDYSFHNFLLDQSVLNKQPQAKILDHLKSVGVGRICR